MDESDTTKGPHSQDFDRLMGLVKVSDDRTLAIIHVSNIEKYLGEAIQSALPGLNSRLRETLFHPDGALGPLGVRNQLAKAMALTNDHQFKNIKLLASIRNKFAHHLEIDSFDHPEISKRISQFIWAEWGIINGWTRESLVKEKDRFKNENNRQKFHEVAVQINILLHNFANHTYHRAKN